ncbi:hypothetical protein [Labedaea rhizosphaerae]|uniref:Uncharacterized protein n=1 Tax=Labedaea rhizosphaerae TaxID=598644 RepID=A0A4R6SA29_LABRH|nr:hypothetical protein [Labedaea rhizosphaerae]TDP96333.1 hypothetical protein EV186_104318 [Labedaea rhizosphaerae]
MPDIGGMVRRAKQGAKQVIGKGDKNDKDSVDPVDPVEAVEPVEPETPEVEDIAEVVTEESAEDAASVADVAEIAEEVGRLRALIERTRPDPGPVTGRWSLGIGDLFAEHPKVPKRLRGLVRKLDRYGGLAITEETVEFDGDDVEWSSVTEIRTRNLVEYLLSDAVDQQLESVPLPWFPGRKRVLDAVGKAVLTLLIAAAKEQLERRDVDIRIPAEVHYRGTLRRRRELAPGVLAALVLADPAVNQCLVATAAAHGIEVREADDDLMADAEERAAKVRAKLAALEAKLGKFRPNGN